MAPVFDEDFRKQLRQLFEWRRDVRRFRCEPLPPGLVNDLIGIACLSPSVGLSQPWRFVLVDDPERRARVRANFSASNAAALAGYAGERAARYARLKLDGLDCAPHQLAVFADRAATAGHGLGRVTMPETIEFSVVAAVTALMLAARAHGVGVGWVSIIDPAALAADIDVPKHWRLIAYLCIGYPAVEDTVPMLQRAEWEIRREPKTFILCR
ncbi:MAG TPA: 5,6-dimethylbenzimidazole synthase [Stellaceae bacterium]|nr:5,6-dimethylbenzimidazole synthase [Stellaceae bacterium]